MSGNRLTELFAQNPTTLLGTADAAGQPNMAVIGSACLVDAEQIALGLGPCRSLANLRANPRATLCLVQPGATVMQWQGARIYLDCVALEETGALFDQTVARIREAAGPGAARRIVAAALFAITEVRPLLSLTP